MPEYDRNSHAHRYLKSEQDGRLRIILPNIPKLPMLSAHMDNSSRPSYLTTYIDVLSLPIHMPTVTKSSVRKGLFRVVCGHAVTAAICCATLGILHGP